MHKGRALVLAPHILYSKDGQQRLDAAIVREDRQVVETPTLTQFNVAELTSVSLTEEPFETVPGFEPDEGDVGEIVCIARIG